FSSRKQCVGRCGAGKAVTEWELQPRPDCFSVNRELPAERPCSPRNSHSVTALPAPHLPLHCFRDENPLWTPCLCSVLADRKPFVRRRKPGSVRATNTSETGWRAIRPTRRKNRQIGKSG